MDLTEALTFARDRRQGDARHHRGQGPPADLQHLVRAGTGRHAADLHDGRQGQDANLRRDPRASLYVQGENFWTWVVIEASAELSAVAADPHDATVDTLVEYYRVGSGEHSDWEEYRAAMVRTSGWCSRCIPSGRTASGCRSGQPAA